MIAAISLDIAWILSIFLITFFIGLPFTLLLSRQSIRFRPLLASIFGYGFIGFITTILYHYGVTYQTLYFVFILIAALSLGAIYQWRRDIFKFDLEMRRQLSRGLAIFLLASAVVFLPYWVGGLKFSLFQGYIHDEVNYTDSAMSYSRDPVAVFHPCTDEFIRQHPVEVFACLNIDKRPGAMHVYGILTQLDTLEQYRWGYLFLGFLALNGVLALAFLIANVFSCSLVRSMTIAGAVGVGFWGQTAIDFNGWPMGCSIPILTAVTAMVVAFAARIKVGSVIAFRELVPLAVLYGFGFYLYPENTIFHLPMLIMVLAFACLKSRMRKLDRSLLKPTAYVALALPAGLCLSVFAYQETVEHLVWILTTLKQGAVQGRNGGFGFSYGFETWGEYVGAIFGQAGWFRPLIKEAVDSSFANFHREEPYAIYAFIFDKIMHEGHFELLFYGLTDVFFGIFGMYFLTPISTWAPWIQNVWRVVLLSAIVFVLRAHVRFAREASDRIRLYFVFVTTLILILVTMLVRADIFGATHAVLYVGGYFMVAVIAPFLNVEKIFSLRGLPLLFLIATQFAFGIARIAVAGSEEVCFRRPYRMAQPVYFMEAKRRFDWDFARFNDDIKDCHKVEVDVTDPWQEYFLVSYLYSRNKSFVKHLPVKSNYWTKQTYGMQAVDGSEDCLFTVEKSVQVSGLPYDGLKFTRRVNSIR